MDTRLQVRSVDVAKPTKTCMALRCTRPEWSTCQVNKLCNAQVEYLVRRSPARNHPTVPRPFTHHQAAPKPGIQNNVRLSGPTGPWVAPVWWGCGPDPPSNNQRGCWLEAAENMLNDHQHSRWEIWPEGATFDQQYCGTKSTAVARDLCAQKAVQAGKEGG